MLPPIKKYNPSKNEYYVLRDGKTPGIYFSYDEALKHKHDGDERPVARAFKNWCEAIYYFKTGEIIPPPPIKKEPKRRPLF
ncbi:MAG: viroplasmin family protein [Bacteroidetes bacterium]|nr:viroplasmin family protein [Bacteroidota bacterium]